MPYLYLASSTSIIPEVEEHRKTLEAAGFTITSTWHQEPEFFRSISPAHLWEICFNQLEMADALLVFPSNARPLRGALIETGFALASHKRVFAVGEHDGDWQHSTRIERRFTLQEFIDSWHD